MDGPEKQLGAVCPSGGTFFVCDDKLKRFVGCCQINPCDTATGDCPDDKLEPATFNKTSHDKIPPQACSDSGSNAPLWYTCASAEPPFMGCCTENPCNSGGCPAKSLRQAVLSNDPAAAAAFLPPHLSSSTQSSTSISSATARSSSISSSIAATSPSTSTGAVDDAPAAANASVDDHNDLSKGAIAGIAVGSIVGAIILLGLLVFWLRRAHRLRRQGARAELNEPTGKQACHGTQSFASGPHNAMLQSQEELYRDRNKKASAPYSLSVGYQPAHGFPNPVQAVELPATSHGDRWTGSNATSPEESPCLGRGGMYDTSRTPSSQQPSQSHLFELEDSSPGHPSTNGRFR